MRTLLFDLDGTLVDSIPLWIDANLQTLKKWKIVMDAQEFLTEFYQQGLHHHGIVEKCGLSTEMADEFYEERNALFEKLLREKVEWMGTAGKVLKACAKRMPLGLMTGATRECIDAMDQRLHLSILFRAIVTYDDTGLRMKPNPYGLLLLTEKLGVDPEECMYVGDQTVDVQAARAIGMKSCLIPTSSTPEGAAEMADHVLGSMEELRNILRDA